MTTIQEDLEKCRVEGNILHLPDIGDTQLKDYPKLKKALENSGAKYKRCTFVFPNDAQSYVDRINVGTTNLKKEYQFFPTPVDVAHKMISLIDWTELPKKCKVLEPSAGQGDLIKPLIQKVRMKNAISDRHHDIKIECCELMPENMLILERMGFIVISQDFMQVPVKPKYDLIIANPPFTRHQDIDHIMHMYEMLKPGGQLVTLCSTSWLLRDTLLHLAFKSFIDEGCDQGDITWSELKEGEFKASGTNIKTTLIHIKKPI